MPEFPLRACFLALPLEDHAKREFQQLQEAIRDYEDILSFQNPLSPHLTLQYWSSLMEIEYKPIIEQMEKIATKTPAFSLKIEGIGTFGYRGENRVLFLSVPFSEPLAKLKKLCPWPSPERLADSIPSKPFYPHITLARIRHPQKFHIAKKKILKLLGSPSFETHVSLLRLYAEIDGKKQTPLLDVSLETS